MKHRNAILLGSTFLLMLAGYVGWCWRNFYLPTSFVYSEDIPEDAVGMLNNWRKSDPYWRPYPFSSRRAIQWLGDPWNSGRQADVIRLGPSDRIVVDEREPGGASFVFIKYDNRWQPD